MNVSTLKDLHHEVVIGDLFDVLKIRSDGGREAGARMQQESRRVCRHRQGRRSYKYRGGGGERLRDLKGRAEGVDSLYSTKYPRANMEDFYCGSPMRQYRGRGRGVKQIYSGRWGQLDRGSGRVAGG